MAHHHLERNHQGLENKLLTPLPANSNADGSIQTRERLAGSLKHCYLEAARFLGDPVLEQHDGERRANLPNADLVRREARPDERNCRLEQLLFRGVEYAETAAPAQGAGRLDS